MIRFLTIESCAGPVPCYPGSLYNLRVKDRITGATFEMVRTITKHSNAPFEGQHIVAFVTSRSLKRIQDGGLFAGENRLRQVLGGLVILFRESPVNRAQPVLAAS